MLFYSSHKALLFLFLIVFALPVALAYAQSDLLESVTEDIEAARVS